MKKPTLRQLKAKQTKDYFISFTKNDKPWADWIAWELNRKGFKVDYQCYDFVPGGNFLSKMNEALKNSKQVISIWSNDYFNSRFASWELEAAHASNTDNGIKVIPIRVANCEVDPLYKPFIYIDLVGKTKFESQRLLHEGLEASRIGVYNQRIKQKPMFPGERYALPPAEKKLIPVKGPIKILFVGSKSSTDLDIIGQKKLLRLALAGLIKQKKVRFICRLDLNIDNIFEIIEKYNPHILHFSGKQDGGNILIESRKNSVTTITEKQLSGLFRSQGENLRLAIIDTCYSYSNAKHISGVVDFTIGVKGYIYDDDAKYYYERLYKAMANGRSLKDAVQQAGTMLSMRKVANLHIPTLFSKRDTDPSSFKLT